ncbi:hypothetical protein HHK36_017797 [Tetracentron sinense]|uniref:BZIP domain-containing protein n=1 Tax=Tetracentron sinense TaxID=13715 RepID=A0A835DDE7_TETSI|nr:hypothetical protein HHK36_017797 [Tetracentron sinense]
MDGGEVDLSEKILLSNPDASSNFQELKSADTYLDENLKNVTCTHTHTCNPPGPDLAHTHTCFHTHTQVFASEEDDGPDDKQESVSKSRRPSGNREAVRKYREKKKAHTAYLEEEVKNLRLLNQQLVRKLQGQAMLEAEVMRLRTLLLDLRGKIDNELGVFPFEKHCNSTTSLKEGDCGIQSIGGGIGLLCETDVPCLHPHVGPSSQDGIGGSTNMVLTWEGMCQPAIVDCQANMNGGLGHNVASTEEHPDCLIPMIPGRVGTLFSYASQADQSHGPFMERLWEQLSMDTAKFTPFGSVGSVSSVLQCLHPTYKDSWLNPQHSGLRSFINSVEVYLHVKLCRLILFSGALSASDTV